MLEFKIVSGKKAGATWQTRHFPVQIGRSPTDNLQLEDNGVWEHHVEVSFDKTQGFSLVARADAPMTINQQPAKSGRLHNGDVIGLGAARLQFWLSPPLQRSLVPHEALVWFLVGAVSLIEVALVYALIQ